MIAESNRYSKRIRCQCQCSSKIGFSVILSTARDKLPFLLTTMQYFLSIDAGIFPVLIRFCLDEDQYCSPVHRSQSNQQSKVSSHVTVSRFDPRPGVHYCDTAMIMNLPRRNSSSGRQSDLFREVVRVPFGSLH